MSEALLEVKNLTIKYDTDGEIVNAVNNITFSLKKGEAFGLVGETGAGKTTTALAILRLLPKYTGKIPIGEIIFNGSDILKKTDKELQELRGKQISMIFQDPMTSLNPVLTVGAQIAEVIRMHDKAMSNEEVEAQVDQILEMVGIQAHRKVEYPHQFSGGMKQRVVIAIAIACNPALLIADEPTTALDVTIQAQVLKMMRELRRKINSAVILITHDLGIVANFCDTVGIMYAGEIVEYGTLEDIFDENKMHHPYTLGLFGSIPKLTAESDRLTPINGLPPDPSNLPTGCSFHPRCPHCQEICKEIDPDIYRSADGTHMIKCHLAKSMEEADSHV